MPNIRDCFSPAATSTLSPDAGRRLSAGAPGLWGPQAPRPGRTDPDSVFAALERDALMPLRPDLFQAVAYTIGRVAPDCHVKSGKALYSVPWRLHRPAGHRPPAGEVRADLPRQASSATHVLQLSGRSTNFEHYPPHKIAHICAT